MASDDPKSDVPPRTLLRRGDQAVLAAIALVSLTMMGGYWITQAAIYHRIVDIDRATPPPIVFQVDVNKADWTEFLQLPEIGEALAREIVAYRQAHGPFRDVSELRQIKGIGKKRFDGLKPFLKPIAS